MNLSQLLSNNKVHSSGFPAISGLGFHSTGTTPAYLSSLPASILFSQGINEYYTLILPRGAQFNTPEEVISVDPDVALYRIESADTAGLPVAVTTQHAATLIILKERYPEAEVLEQIGEDGVIKSLSSTDVQGKHVVGVLPPFLVSAAAAFTAVSITNYNAITDGDLSLEDLQGRLQIADKAITVQLV